MFPVKKYFGLIFPIGLLGCFLMILLENMWEIDFGLIPFFIWGVLSSIIGEWVSQKYNLFND